MSLVCAQCSRVNPPEAAYCYHDGAALAGRSSGPLNAGSAPFPNQFVFPNGTACRNFDQLAMACQQNWTAAIDLLKQGFLGSFFGGLGRVDLAVAAQDAAQFPDTDRGLDQLLGKLPTQALQAPKLQAEPSEINLGQVKIGQDRTIELHLANHGMRLLYGNVVSDCKWLTIGEAAGQPEKIFQFSSESVLHIQVRGQHMRAGSKPLEGHLVVDSNGGTSTVTVRADVPIAPFPGGPFDGAITPRQIAEKAKANPKGTAPLFESGAIAKWYASNGWNYPVQGPTMSGMGAIQQFFEALGVAKAPKIEFSTKAFDLQGGVGQTVQASIDVTTPERKVVYGWATCDQPWVEIGKTKLTGKSAAIPITIRIPTPAPPVMEASIKVTGNGNQQTVIPLKLTVAGGKKGVALPEPEMSAPVMIAENAPPVLEIADKRKKTPIPVNGPVASSAVSAAPAAAARDDNPFAVTDSPVVPSAGARGVATSAPAGVSKSAGGLPLIVRLILLCLPIVLLSTCLLGLIVRDIFAPAAAHKVEGGGSDGDGDGSADIGPVDPNPHIMIKFDEGFLDKDYSDSMNFAVHKIDPNDKTAASIRLNWYPNGLGNSVVARIDGKDNLFGNTVYGQWPKKIGNPEKAGKYGGKTRTFEFTRDGIYLTQTVTLEPGEPVEGAGESKRPLSLALARYKIHNKDARSHKVGMRVLLDTCIGDNDGVPFTLPGVNELVSTSKDFRGKEVPDFVQILEKPDLSNPGIVVQLNLRINEKLEFPGRFLLTRYPVTVSHNKRDLHKWDVPVVPFGDDSCVVMYWEEKEMKANESREVAFSYGLGNVATTPGAGRDRLGLTVGGAMHVRGELTVVALIADPKAKLATLKLPSGLELIEGVLAQPVPPMRQGEDKKYRPVPVTWRVRAVSPGRHNIEVDTDSGLKQSRHVAITPKSLF